MGLYNHKLVEEVEEERDYQIMVAMLANKISIVQKLLLGNNGFAAFQDTVRHN